MGREGGGEGEALWSEGMAQIAETRNMYRYSWERHHGHGCLFVVSVVCCQVEVSAKD